MIECSRFFACRTTEEERRDCLKWWRENSHRFPNYVAWLARQLLAIQASSAPSERLFSELGYVMNPKRAQLLLDRAVRLVVMKKNMRELRKHGRALEKKYEKNMHISLRAHIPSRRGLHEKRAAPPSLQVW